MLNFNTSFVDVRISHPEILFIVIWLLETSLCIRMSMVMFKLRWQILDSLGELVHVQVCLSSESLLDGLSS